MQGGAKISEQALRARPTVVSLTRFLKEDGVVAFCPAADGPFIGKAV